MRGRGNNRNSRKNLNGTNPKIYYVYYMGEPVDGPYSWEKAYTIATQKDAEEPGLWTQGRKND